MASNYETTTERVSVIKTATGASELKSPVDVERGADGRLTPESVSALRGVRDAMEKHHADKEANKANMEAAMAQVTAMKDPALAQVAALTESSKNSSSMSVPAKVQSQKSAVLA